MKIIKWYETASPADRIPTLALSLPLCATKRDESFLPFALFGPIVDVVPNCQRARRERGPSIGKYTPCFGDCPDIAKIISCQPDAQARY